VTKEADWTTAIDLAVSRFGKLDILVNNAGVFIGKGIEEISLDEWNKLVAVNMTGVFLGTKLAVPALREAGKSSEHGSAIVNLASIAGIVGSQLDPLYSMTKGGVTLFTKSAADGRRHASLVLPCRPPEGILSMPILGSIFP
jgi:NAD(P)-dependent dehydrogenase (short-subunit alcohol dehydrogenase family)